MRRPRARLPAPAASGPTLVGVLEKAHDVAADALARTPEMLPVLARAGVVDAGGSGLLLLVDAFWSVVDDHHALPEPSGVTASVDYAGLNGAGRDAVGERDPEEGAGDEGQPTWATCATRSCTSCTRRTTPSADFKEVWAGIGDSIVVVGGDGLWNCHIHTDDIGAAIEAGVDAGRPQRIRVTDLVEQVEEERWVREASSAPAAGVAREGPVPTTSVVAVVTGDGIGRIFRSLGVHHQVVGGQSMNPSTEDLLKVVDIGRLG